MNDFNVDISKITLEEQRRIIALNLALKHSTNWNLDPNDDRVLIKSNEIVPLAKLFENYLKSGGQ